MKRPNPHKVLITDLDCPSALASVRALGRAGFELHGLGCGAFVPARLSRYITSYAQSPSPWSGLEAFQGALLRRVELCRPDLILPVSEAAIQCVRMFRNKSFFGENSILMGSDLLLDLGLSKIATFQRAIDAQLPVASGCVLFPEQPFELGSSLKWPLVVRTDNSFSGGSRYRKGRSWIVKGQREFAAIRSELDSLNAPCLVQEYIEGFGCGAFFLLWHGEVILWHSHRRLAEIPWYGGISARRKIEFDENLLNIGKCLFSDSGFSGLAMIEFRVCGSKIDATSPHLHIVEVNARPWGSMSLALHAGIPFVPVWADLFLSKSPRTPTERVLNDSKKAVMKKNEFVCTSLYPGEFQHLLSVFRSWWKNELSYSSSICFLRRTLLCLINPRTRFDYVVFDDLIPSVIQLLIFIKRIFGYLISMVTSVLRNLLWSLFARFARRPALKELLSRRATKSILVVCMGNRCRSPFFEKLLRSQLDNAEFKIYSRGFLENCKGVPQRFFGIFKAYGIDHWHHRATPLSRVDIDSADCIFLMEYNHFFKILKEYGWASLKRCYLPSEIKGVHIEICDPFVLEPLKASRVFDELQIYASHISSELKDRGIDVSLEGEHQ